MPGRYVRSRHSLWPRVGAHTNKLAVPLQRLPKTSNVSCRIASSLRRHPLPRTTHKTVAHRGGQAHLLSPVPKSTYFVWSRNRKHVKYIIRIPGKTTLEPHIAQMPTSLFCLQISQNRLLHSFLSFLLSTAQFAQHRLCSQKEFSFMVSCFWFAKNA